MPACEAPRGTASRGAYYNQDAATIVPLPGDSSTRVAISASPEFAPNLGPPALLNCRSSGDWLAGIAGRQDLENFPVGGISSVTILGDLHHHYCQISFAVGAAKKFSPACHTSSLAAPQFFHPQSSARERRVRRSGAKGEANTDHAGTFAMETIPAS